MAIESHICTPTVKTDATNRPRRERARASEQRVSEKVREERARGTRTFVRLVEIVLAVLFLLDANLVEEEALECKELCLLLRVEIVQIGAVDDVEAHRQLEARVEVAIWRRNDGRVSKVGGRSEAAAPKRTTWPARAA